MKISLVIPVFNEEGATPVFYKTVRRSKGLKQHEVEIAFINNGNKDTTESIIDAFAIANPLIVPLSFTRSFGREPTLFAGLDHATGDIIIPIDVDLQDPMGVISHMIDKWQSSVDMVLAKRSDRSTDGRLKRKTAEWFYRLYSKISNPQTEENVEGFRLMSRGMVENTKPLLGRNLFTKGVLSWVGRSADVVEYARAERIAGSTKFNGWKSWNLAPEDVTSFSASPLRMWIYTGLLVTDLAFPYRMWIIIDTLAFGNPVRSYPLLLASILFLGGAQLTGISVLGKRIGRIYVETKDRPRCVIKGRK